MEKRLYRSREKKVVGGVAGGLGNYLDIDPVILRIIFILITIFKGIGILIYIILWIALEEETERQIYLGENKNEFSENDFSEEPERIRSEESANVEKTNNSSGKIILGVVLILLGIFFLLEKFIPYFDFEILFAVGAVVAGIFLIYNSFNKSEIKK